MSAPRLKLRMYVISGSTSAVLTLFLTWWVGPLPLIGVIVGCFLIGLVIGNAHS